MSPALVNAPLGEQAHRFGGLDLVSPTRKGLQARVHSPLGLTPQRDSQRFVFSRGRPAVAQAQPGTSVGETPGTPWCAAQPCHLAQVSVSTSAPGPPLACLLCCFPLSSCLPLAWCLPHYKFYQAPVTPESDSFLIRGPDSLYVSQAN